MATSLAVLVGKIMDEKSSQKPNDGTEIKLDSIRKFHCIISQKVGNTILKR